MRRAPERCPPADLGGSRPSALTTSMPGHATPHQSPSASQQPPPTGHHLQRRSRPRSINERGIGAPQASRHAGNLEGSLPPRRRRAAHTRQPRRRFSAACGRRQGASDVPDNSVASRTPAHDRARGSPGPPAGAQPPTAACPPPRTCTEHQSHATCVRDAQPMNRWQIA